MCFYASNLGSIVNVLPEADGVKRHNDLTTGFKVSVGLESSGRLVGIRRPFGVSDNQQHSNQLINSSTHQLSSHQLIIPSTHPTAL